MQKKKKPSHNHISEKDVLRPVKYVATLKRDNNQTQDYEMISDHLLL